MSKRQYEDILKCGAQGMDVEVFKARRIRPTTPDKVPDQACDAGWWYVSEGWKPNKDVKCTAILSSKIARTESP